MTSHAWAVAVLFAAIIAPATAQAQASSEAEKLFREGRRLMEAGDLAHACPKFAESERLEPAPGTLLNLADCEERAGQLVSAQEHYRLAASGFPKADKRRDFAAGKASGLDARIAHVTLRLAADAPAGASVKKNGEPMKASDLGVAMATDPGKLEVTVSATGRLDKPYSIPIKDGASIEMTLQAGEPVPEQPPPTFETPKAKSSPVRPIGVVVGVLGVASLGVGVVTGIMAIDRANTVKTHCNTTTGQCSDNVGYAAAQDGVVLSPLSTITVIAGGVLAATGAVLFIVGGKSSSSNRAWLSPMWTTTAAGAALGGTF